MMRARARLAGLLCLLVGLARARTRERGDAPSRIVSRTACLYAACTALASPLLQPANVGLALDALPLSRSAPARAVMLDVATALHELRTNHALTFVLLHVLATDVAADVLAQAIDCDGAQRIVLDRRRIGRSAAVAMLSDDLPFLLWSRLLWHAGERAVASLRASRRLPSRQLRVLTHGATVAVAKMLMTQLLYESASDAAYLSLQAA